MINSFISLLYIMKKLLALLTSALVLAFVAVEASWLNPTKTITLSHWWNVVSTPAILSSIDFSNGWEGITFSKLDNWEWKSVAATVANIKPLEWFMVYNNNDSDVSMLLTYKEDVSPAQSILQKDLDYWWNLLWITTTDSPFSNIWSAASMSIDMTDWTNKVWSSYIHNSTSSSVANPELGEAYFVYVNQQNGLYGWVNNVWTVIEDTPAEEPVDDVTKDLAYVTSMVSDWAETTYTFKAWLTNTNIVLFTSEKALNEPITVEDWTTLLVANWFTTENVVEIWYNCIEWTTTSNDCEMVVKKSEHNDFFKVWPTYLKVYKVN